jgi:hypothetical protein
VDVELVELSLEADVLEDALVDEALDVELSLLVLEPLALWRARSRVCRSLLSLEIAPENGGGGRALLADEVDVALVLDVEPAACEAASRSAWSICHC